MARLAAILFICRRRSLRRTIALLAISAASSRTTKRDTQRSETAASASSLTASAIRAARWCSASCRSAASASREGEPRLHQAYYDKVWTFGLKIMSDAGTEELLSYYPPPVKDWISRNGGLTPELKRVRNAPSSGR